MNYVHLLTNTPAAPYNKSVAKSTDEEVMSDFQFVMTSNRHEDESQQQKEKLEVHQEHDLVEEAEIVTTPIFETLELETRREKEEVLTESVAPIELIPIIFESTAAPHSSADSDITDEVLGLADVEKAKLAANKLRNEQVSELVLEINQVLRQTVSGENSTRNTSQLLHVLQRWTNLQQSELDPNVRLENELPENLMKVWEELTDIFRKRDFMAKNQLYQTDSAITKAEVMNWLQHALERHMPNQETENIYTYTTSNQPLPLSVTQQHTIYVQNLEKVEAISNELVHRLGQVIRNSNFIQQQGLQQLTITLKPETLGDITVRMVQVNGEMTVKLLVTTQVARELLEGNLHQLKPMFAPHQIVIERDAGVSDEEYYQEGQEQAEEEKHDSLKDTDEGQQKETEETPFQDILSFISEEVMAE